jgi:hypothetical protein
MKKLTVEEEQVLTAFMQENNITSESKLYRYTSKNYLKELNGEFYLEAKKEPTDMVVDRYHGFWEVFLASEVGPGISFLSQREDEYERSDRVCVEVQLKDVLNQGGLVYGVTSLPAYLKAFFCTLPDGKVKAEVSIIKDKA